MVSERDAPPPPSRNVAAKRSGISSWFAMRVVKWLSPYIPELFSRDRGAMTAASGERLNGIIPWVSWRITGERGGDMAAMVFTALVCYVGLSVSVYTLPAPRLLGGRWFTFACLYGAAVAGT